MQDQYLREATARQSQRELLGLQVVVYAILATAPESEGRKQFVELMVKTFEELRELYFPTGKKVTSGDVDARQLAMLERVFKSMGYGHMVPPTKPAPAPSPVEAEPPSQPFWQRWFPVGGGKS